jgi:beta-glucosidase
MKTKRNMRLVAALMLMLLGGALSAQDHYPFQNPKLPSEERISNILASMTLEEKIAVLGTSTAVPRLGIPDAGLSEGLHGLVQRSLGGFGEQKTIPTTQFSQVVGMAQTWDEALIRRAGEVQGTEARWIFLNKEKYNRTPVPLVVWGPNADLARDPRWGRIDESYGEDPFFVGTMASAFVKGMQGDDPNYWRVASLLKHFLANSNEHGRYGSNSDFDEQMFREYYSVPFRMAFEGGAKSYMASYNAWNQVPMTVNPALRNVLAKEWQVDGIVSTDAGAVRNMVSKHNYYPGMKEAVAACIKTGVNQFLDGYQEGLREALKENLISETDIDAALRGKYRVVIRLGLLDPPAQVSYASPTSPEEPWQSEAHKAVARQIAREGIVLLKNAGGLLPLDREKVKSIAVYGPRANKVLLGLYSGEPPYTVSPLEGLQKRAGTAIKINMGRGFMADPSGAAKSSDIAVVFVGNDPLCNRLSIIANFGSDNSWCETPSDGMENSDRQSIDLEQEELIKQVFAANPRTIVVLLSDFPYAINWTNEHVPAILNIGQNAQEAGTAIADVLFGDYNPAGRTVVTWPKSLSQLPPMMDYNIRHGHTYMYFRDVPLYPFGYGLSYTSFTYSNLRLSAPQLKKSAGITASVDITNSGSRAGDEIVQLYVQHENSKQTRPQKELRGFRRISLKPGETTTVKFDLQAKSVAWWNESQHRFEVEADTIKLLVGSSSADLKLNKELPVVD